MLLLSGVDVFMPPLSALSKGTDFTAYFASSWQYPFSIESYNHSDLTIFNVHFRANWYFWPTKEDVQTTNIHKSWQLNENYTWLHHTTFLHMAVQILEENHYKIESMLYNRNCSLNNNCLDSRLRLVKKYENYSRINSQPFKNTDTFSQTSNSFTGTSLDYFNSAFMERKDSELR